MERTSRRAAQFRRAEKTNSICRVHTPERNEQGALHRRRIERALELLVAAVVRVAGAVLHTGNRVVARMCRVGQVVAAGRVVCSSDAARVSYSWCCSSVLPSYAPRARGLMRNGNQVRSAGKENARPVSRPGGRLRCGLRHHQVPAEVTQPFGLRGGVHAGAMDAAAIYLSVRRMRLVEARRGAAGSPRHLNLHRRLNGDSSFPAREAARPPFFLVARFISSGQLFTTNLHRSPSPARVALRRGRHVQFVKEEL